MKSLLRFTFLAVLVVFMGCADKQKNHSLDTIAEKYVRLVLNVGTHAPVFVDAYYGPKDLQPDTIKMSIKELITESQNLMIELENIDLSESADVWKQRKNFLMKQLTAVNTYCKILSGEKISFDEQSKKLYDAVSPVYSNDSIDSLLNKLDLILPGEGDLYNRYNELKKKFIIPEENVSKVFDAAIAECRKRTKQLIDLPGNENFTTEYVKDQVWGAYNWYKGNNFSLIQINTDLPKQILSAVGLASHEGYPGHHVYNVLLENKLYKKMDWVEYCVYPLFSPQSLIAEGTANYGVEIIFPKDERKKFEIEILFPLAGINVNDAEVYYEAVEIAEKLAYADNNISRDLIDGKITDEQAVERMIKTLSTRERAEKSLGFIKANGAYVITYNVGKDIVEKYIRKKAGDDREKTAKVFFDLLSRPATASELEF